MTRAGDVSQPRHSLSSDFLPRSLFARGASKQGSIWRVPAPGRRWCSASSSNIREIFLRDPHKQTHTHQQPRNKNTLNKVKHNYALSITINKQTKEFICSNKRKLWFWGAFGFHFFIVKSTIKPMGSVYETTCD